MRAYRKERVASEVRSIVSDAILHKLSDPRIGPLTTVTRVVMSGDLLIANVYVSVPGGDAEEKKILRCLQHATGFLQRIVAGELNLRQAPELNFAIDESLKVVRRTLDIIEQNRLQHPEWSADEEKEDEQTDGPMADNEEDVA